MNERERQEFERECAEFLNGFSLNDLRAYGRSLGMKQPTMPKKDALLRQILAILGGERPAEGRSKRGAPVLNKEVNAKILEGVERLCARYGAKGETPSSALPEREQTVQINDYSSVPPFDFEKELAAFRARNKAFRLEDPEGAQWRVGDEEYPVFRGQFCIVDRAPFLATFDGKNSCPKIFIPVEQVESCDLREGDIVSCHAKRKGEYWLTTQILTINDIVYEGKPRPRARFEERELIRPFEPLPLYADEKNASTACKYLSWLAPFSLGQRVLLTSAPKFGKTTLLARLIRGATQGGVTVLGVLVGQPPEYVGIFRRLFQSESFAYSTFEDEPEKQVFVAEAMLARAKRLAEKGENVLLAIDSLNALAAAFNDTDASSGGKTLACGLERKTLQYLTKYFGSARAFEGGGSLTIVGTLAKDTGNPADDVLHSELSALSSYYLCLCPKLALRRIEPALDLRTIRTNSRLPDCELFERVVREFLPNEGAEKLLRVVEASRSKEEFSKNLS